jgi:surface antigen
MSFVRLSAAALAMLSLAACSGTPETGQGPKENTGTLVGAVAGGLIGSQFGGGVGERIAAGLAGAALGGLIGNRIGAGMDDDDKRRAYAAQMQTLEAGKSGVAVAWKNPDCGRYGRHFSRGVAATTLALGYHRSRRTMRGTWLRQIYEVPLPHVAASTVVRRCRGTARRDVTALGVPRSATVLFSPRRQGNVNSIRRIDR